MNNRKRLTERSIELAHEHVKSKAYINDLFYSHKDKILMSDRMTADNFINNRPDGRRTIFLSDYQWIIEINDGKLIADPEKPNIISKNHFGWYTTIHGKYLDIRGDLPVEYRSIDVFDEEKKMALWYKDKRIYNFYSVAMHGGYGWNSNGFKFLPEWADERGVDLLNLTQEDKLYIELSRKDDDVY